tara:strand:- start:201 stop:416 length:216 start_codon:yes stop_codon:yes gene_type:complete
MFKVGELVRYFTCEDFYYGSSDRYGYIGLIVDTQPKWYDSRDYNWYNVLLNGDIKIAREDDIYKLTEDKDV